MGAPIGNCNACKSGAIAGGIGKVTMKPQYKKSIIDKNPRNPGGIDLETGWPRRQSKMFQSMVNRSKILGTNGY